MRIKYCERVSETEIYISAAEAATRLGVSGTGLRRLADIYAEVADPLERDSKTNNRLWTLTVVERLEEARAIMHAGRAGSIKDALIAAAEGVEAPAGSLSAPGGSHIQGIALEMLAQRFETIEQDNREIKVQLRQLLELNQQFSRQLEAPREQNAELEEQRRLNTYLLGELQRRRGEEEDTRTRKRAWWQVWKRL